MHLRELFGLPLMVRFYLYHLLTGALQLVTMLSTFVALDCGTISLFHSEKPSHKQLLEEMVKLTFSIIISEYELFPTII